MSSSLKLGGKSKDVENGGLGNVFLSLSKPLGIKSTMLKNMMEVQKKNKTFLISWASVVLKSNCEYMKILTFDERNVNFPHK